MTQNILHINKFPGINNLGVNIKFWKCITFNCSRIENIYSMPVNVPGLLRRRCTLGRHIFTDRIINEEMF